MYVFRCTDYLHRLELSSVTIIENGTYSRSYFRREMNKTTTLAIKSGTAFSDIEEFYGLLERNKTQINLKLPRKLAYGGTIGIGTAVNQLIGSWSRSPLSASLISYPSISGNNFVKMLEYPHGLIAAYMSREIIGAQGAKIDRTELLKHATERIESMSSGDLNNTLKGPGVFLCCFAGARNEFLRSLYQQSNTSGIRSSSDFIHLTRKIINSCDETLSEKIQPLWLKDIAVLVRELFENTNDHAVQDENNRDFTWTYPNVRGLLARKTILSSSGRKDIFKDHRSAIAYSHLLLNSTEKHLPMIELTVFDFGPGIARRYLSVYDPQKKLEEIPVEKEREIVENAFKLNVSTKNGSGVGIGLDSVVKSLGKLNAYIRLRTGRLCLWQECNPKTKELKLENFYPKQPQLACATGTTYNILIPSKKGNSTR